jgi:uncharacterized membrane protein (UPF0127 family)
MDSRWIGYAAVALAALGAVALLAFSTGAIAPLLGDGYDPNAVDPEGPDDGNESDTPSAHSDYEHTTVIARDGETGAELGRLQAAIADTRSKRYLGLSATEELPEDRGMLFVHDEPGEYTYVMREMSFGIDIVFVAADGTITTIHEAPAPGPNEDGNTQRYPGEGQYVLEVNRGWTTERGVEVGDEFEFEL